MNVTQVEEKIRELNQRAEGGQVRHRQVTAVPGVTGMPGPSSRGCDTVSGGHPVTGAMGEWMEVLGPKWVRSAANRDKSGTF